MQKSKDKKQKGKNANQTADKNTKQEKPKAEGAVQPIMKFEEVGITAFIEQKFQKHIEEGLKEIVHNRPDDPIKYLGQFLLKRSQQIK